MLEVFSSFNDIALLGLRLALAIIFIYHGLPKLRQPAAMAKMVAMPTAMIFVLGAMEFGAGVLLALGYYAQIAALVLAVVMVGALMMKIFKWRAPFSAMDKMGWEFDLILLAASLVVLTVGPGAIGVN